MKKSLRKLQIITVSTLFVAFGGCSPQLIQFLLGEAFIAVTTNIRNNRADNNTTTETDTTTDTGTSTTP